MKGGAGMDNHDIDNIQSEILEWVKTIKFKKKLIGGLDEEDVLKKIEELNRLYEKALMCERTKYNTLLESLQGGDGK